MRTLFLYIFIVCFYPVLAQENPWVLAQESDDIKVYTRKKIGEKFKELRIITRHQTSLNAIMAAFDDTEAHKEWVYKTPESYTIEKVDSSTLIYYVKSDLPFPVSDRDIVIKYKWVQDPDTKVIVTESVGIVGKVDEDDSIIRVTDFASIYTLTPQPDGWVDIEYYAMMDPAGMLPAWLVNMVVTRGPVKTMDNLFDLLDSGRYDNVQVGGVVELGH